MIDFKCCVCGEVMKEMQVGIEFVRFTNARTSLYNKLYAYFCEKCKKFRQVEDEGIVR